MALLKIGVVGCAGKMGESVLTAINEDVDSKIIGGTEKSDSSWLGQDIGEIIGENNLGINVHSDAKKLFSESDAIIDFTSTQTIYDHAELAEKFGRVWILGTTGTCKGGDEAIEKASKKAANVRASNMSLGVNLLTFLVRKTAEGLGLDFDTEIVDFHHRQKLDAPSGTALTLGRAIAEARNQNHDEEIITNRLESRKERKLGGIGYSSIRGGDVVGDHTVIFTNNEERIELTHRASSRSIFARGALKAAHWANGKPAGLYSMSDVLDLNI